MHHLSWIAVVALTATTLGLPLRAHADGKATFDTNCSSCHGVEGRGDGPSAAAFEARPPDFKDARYWSSLGPEWNIHMVKTITKGGGSTDHSTNMPAWEPVLTPDQVLEIIAYLRQLAGPAALEKPAAAPPVDAPVDPTPAK